MMTYRPPQLRQAPFFGPTFAVRSWTVGQGFVSTVVPHWLQAMRTDAEQYLTDHVEIVERVFGLSALRTRTVTDERTVARVKGRLQRGAGQVNASERTQQGGVRRTEGYSLRLPVGTPIPPEGKVIIAQGFERLEFEIAGHDPLRTDAVLLTVWLVKTEGITT